MSLAMKPNTLFRFLFGTRALGFSALGLAAAAGVFTGSELYLAVQTTSPLLSHGVVYFWPVVLRLIGLVLDVTAATVAVLGGALMLLRLRTGRRLVVAALTAGIAGETVLAFVDSGQYTKSASIVWIVLLVGGYLLLIVSAILHRHRSAIWETAEPGA
ncbi:MAG: hypothetical protein ACRENX_03695 [Candidatus Dormibacteria bacterium]